MLNILFFSLLGNSNFLLVTYRMYPSAEHMSPSGPNLQIGTTNTGGSLPDLTNLHIPSPLPTPIDPDEQVNQVLSPQQFQMAQRQSPTRRQQGNHQPLRKPQYMHDMPLMPGNISPNLEDRLQQFQLYPPGNAINNDFISHGNVPITTSSSPTLSPTSSAPITPLFGNLPTSPMSSFSPELYFKQQQSQQQLSQQPNTLSLQQQLEQFSMHRPMLNTSMQLPFQSLLSQTPTTIPQGISSLANFYGGHSRVPDLIVTPDDGGHKSDLAKDLSSAMANTVGDDPGELYSSDVVLDPLDVEGFQMLSGQESELTDAATEDQFRLDRLG